MVGWCIKIRRGGKKGARGCEDTIYISYGCNVACQAKSKDREI